MPQDDLRYSAQERSAWPAVHEKMRALRAEISQVFADHFANAVVDAASPQMQLIDQMCRMNLDMSVPDEALRARLQPNYHAACKRLVISPDFYQAIQQSHAELVTAGIEQV